MANDTEKLTINLGVVELAQIDVLVEQGIYSNRSDFIRTSVRKCLESYGGRIELQLSTVSSKKSWVKIIGIFAVSKKTLEKLAKDDEKLNISVIGMVIVDNNISVELFEETVENIILRGKLVASNEIKEIIKKMN